MKTEAAGAGHVRVEAGTAGLQAASGAPSPHPCFPQAPACLPAGTGKRGFEPVREEMLEDGESCLEEIFQASGTPSSWVKTHWFPVYNCHCSIAKSRPTLKPDGLQHARLPCPSPSPGVFPDSRPLSR